MKKNKKKALEEKLLQSILYIIYPLCAISALIISPVYTVTHANIAYKFLPIIFKIILMATDLFIIYFSLAIMIYALIKYDFRRVKKVIIWAMAAPFFKNLLKMMISPLVDGIPSKDQIVLDIYSLLLSALLEFLQLLIIIFVSYQTIKGYKDKLYAYNKARQKIDEKHLPDMSLTPFKKAVSIGNPLQCSALISSGIVTLIRIGMLLYSDIKNYNSFPEKIGDAILFFGAYFLEFIIGVIGYILMLYIFISISSKEED